MNSGLMNNGGRVRTRVKICGLTRLKDAFAAADAGADAIGLVFAKSPRQVTVETAAQIARAMPAFVSTVGLFVDASADEVEQVMRQVPIDVLQFHGNETPEYCEQFGRGYVKAIRMRDDVDLEVAAQRYRNAQALLLDAYVPGVAGGTGTAFDWSRISPKLPLSVVLAGGLTPDNVADAIVQTQPWAVDTSGGVERDKGIKSAEKISRFIAGVNDGDSRRTT